MRRSLAAIAAIGVLGACAVQPAGADDTRNLLVPVTVIVGGLGTAPATPPGFPPGHRPPPAFVKLMFPSALAATASDIFVADSGLGALLRIDPVTNAVSSLRALPVLPGVRLAAAPDGTLYVLSPDRGEILRLARDGRTLATHADLAEVARPVALATEPNRNTVLVADASGEVYAFGSLDGPAEPLPYSEPAGDEGPNITLLARASRAVVGYDSRCQCLIALDRDAGLAPLTPADGLIRPTAMVADNHGRMWIIDAGDGLLKLFDAAGELTRIAPARLGLSQVSALAAHHHRLYVADGPGGRIAVFDILPPPSGDRR